MNIKNIKTSTEKEIIVIDNAFSMGFRSHAEGFICSSSFKNEGCDYNTHLSLSSGIYNLCSTYSNEDVKNFGILNQNEYINDFIQNKIITNAKVHLLTVANVSSPHTDSTDYTFLYYPSLYWDVRFGGETVFYSDDLKEIEYSSLYVPGRCIIFNGSIPHMGKAPTVLATKPRYTFALNLQTKNNND
jgi:hypothetical protein